MDSSTKNSKQKENKSIILANNIEKCEITIEFLQPILSVIIPKGISKMKIKKDKIAYKIKNSDMLTPLEVLIKRAIGA